MSSKWPLVTVEDIAAKQPNAMSTGPFGSAISSKYFTDSGVPVIRGSNLSTDIGTRIIDKGIVFVSFEKAKEFRRSVAKVGDLVFTCWGTINQIGLIDGTSEWEEYIISNKQMKLTVNKSIADPRYVYYVFSSPAKQLEIIANGIGAAVPGFNLGQLKKHSLKTPPLNIQRAIANHLELLDKKITSNNKMNQTLEQMAQTLFKSWFVDFEPVKAKIAVLEAGGSEEEATLAAMTVITGKNADSLIVFEQEHPEKHAELKATAELFPAAMQGSELGEIPSGWNVSSIKDMGNVICGKTPSKQESQYYGKDVPFIKIPDMHDQLFVLKTNEYLSDSGSKSQSKKLLPAGSICVSCIATIGVIAITTRPSHTNQQINTIIPFKESSLYYLYFCMKGLNDYLHVLGSAGSATLNVNTSTFSGIKIITPDAKVLECYSRKCEVLFNEIKSLSFQIESLIKIRDTLLPKLLSGEITLPEAEQAVSETTHV